MKNYFNLLIMAMTPILLVIGSCRKEINNSILQRNTTSSENNNSKNKGRIEVSSVDELYSAVNDPDNASTVIQLEAGTYVLSASYPNGGRLELQSDMFLLGQPGDREEVIIDASLLPGTSFVPPNNFPAARTGAIRMGRGFNGVEWLTVKGNSSQQALSVIDTDLFGVGETRVKIAHSVVTGGRIGIDIRNVGLVSAGRTIEAEIDDNEVKENLVEFGQGIEVQNANGASRAIIVATLNGNVFHNNKIGMRSFNNNASNIRTDSGSITIQSNADSFVNNGIAIYLAAGLNQGTTTTANDNSISFEAHGTVFNNNNGVLPPEQNPLCGIFAAGGRITSTGTASRNKLEMNFWGCEFFGNYQPDISAFGAFSKTALIAGVNNYVDVYLHGVSADAITNATPSQPVEPAATNVVNIYR